MSFLKELTDKGATIAWSNVESHPNLLALGTKDSGGSGFDDYGGELELHKLDFSQETDGAGTLLGKVKTSARFATLAWSEMATKQAEYPYGLIAGGMGDGTVNVWDPAKLVASHPQPQVASVQRHTGPVTGLHFNPHKSSSHLLASGGADSEVFIMALDRPDAPNVFVPGPKPNTSRHTAEVSKVAWNSQVSHIMATAAQNGSTIVWDLKQKKPWCELRDSNRAPVTDVAWNPEQGLHLVTASGDDNNPVLKLWDLRSSTTLPLATLSGHTEGVLSVGWCPTDASLLMSCAKDNRTLLWDLFSLQPVYELSPGAGESLPQETTKMFGGYGKTAQRRYQVSWSPHIPAVVGTCSFDRKVQLFSMNGAKTSNGRAPTWHRRPAGASFAFGGRLASFSKGSYGGAHAGANGQQGGHGSKMVKLSSVQEDKAFVDASRRFEQAMASQGFREFCQEKEAKATDAHERKVWQFMQIIFEKNARNQLLAHLGFDGEDVARQAAEFVAKSGASEHTNGSSHHASQPPPPPPLPPTGGEGAGEMSSGNGNANGIGHEETELSAVLDAVDLATPPAPKGIGSKAGSLFASAAPTHGGGDSGVAANGQPQLSKAAEATIKRSLVVGNFEAAVQCCMSTGNMADAMILASCGGAELWAKTQAQYFARESSRRPFLRVVNAIIKSELGGLVEASDLSQWQETLAILSTYAKQEELPALCEALAARLENEVGDRKSANLCYMCAVKVPKTVEMWAEELRAANAAVAGGTDTKALQEFVEKVSVFTQKPSEPAGEEVAAIFAEYAGILASEGEMETAAKYIQGQDRSGAVLMDRLYHAAPHAAGTQAPPFPFERQRIGVSPQSVVDGRGTGHQATKVSNTAVAATPAADPRTSGGEPALPPGWTQLTDPQRGIPYYYNTTTRETQWERPPPPPQQPRAVPAPAPAATPSPYNPSPHKPAVSNLQTSTQMAPSMRPYASSASSSMSSARQPAFQASGPTPGPGPASQVHQPSGPMAAAAFHGGNVTRAGMGIPAVGHGEMPMRPAAAGGLAPGPGVGPMADSTGRGAYGMPAGGLQQQMQEAASPAPAPQAAPAPAPAPSDADSQAVVSAINGMLAALSEIPLSAPEKKMLGDATKMAGVLFGKMGQGQVERDTLDKVKQLVESLQVRNLPAATAIQQGLANSAWVNHKDWLKGLKHLITLVSRRL